MIQFISGKLAEITALIKMGLGVAAIVIIGMTWWRTRALVPTLTSMIVAGTVMWGVNNVSWFQNKIAEETQPKSLRTLTVAIERSAPRPPIHDIHVAATRSRS